MLDTCDPVLALLEAYASDQSWWCKQVRAAERAFFTDLGIWYNERRLGADSTTASVVSALPRRFSCYLCQAEFPLRKHLHVHLARSHRVFSPARHFALGNTCTACLKVFPNVRQVQQHLKHSDWCLLRCLHLHAPLEYEQFRALEVACQASEAKVAKGNWKAFTGLRRTAKALQAFGPPMPTAAEKTIESVSDDDPLSCLSRGFEPSPAHVVWINDHVNSHSQEGSRTTAHRFWSQRPTFHLRI